MNQIARVPGWVVDLLTFGAVAVLIAAVLGSRFDYGVVMHDMGTIGHAAERVLQGELPHRDFDDPYTGLLSLLNATAFRWWGIGLFSTRVVLLIATLLGFSMVYFLCRRAASPWLACLATTAAFLASVPNYFASMPTWYNLYAALGGAAAMIRYAETGRLRWVLAAGACTGMSFLFKSVGIYFAPAAALFAVFIEQRRSEKAASNSAPSAVASWLTIGGLVAYATVPAALVAGRFTLPTFLTFVAPSLIFVAYLCWNERRLRWHGPRERLQRLVRVAMAFAVGFAVVVGVYLLPYAATNDIDAWFNGVFVKPLTRLDSELLGRPFNADSYVGAVLIWVVLAVLAIVARRSDSALRWMLGVVFGIGAIVLGTAFFESTYAMIWSAARLIPLAAAAGLCWHLAVQSRRSRRRQSSSPPEDSALVEAAFLLLATAGVFGLVQYPLSHGIYFLYVVPLVVPAAVATLLVLYPGHRLPAVLFAGWVTAFALCWMLPGRTTLLGIKFQASQKSVHLAAERCPMLCDARTAYQYGEIVRLVQRHTPPGAKILAFPDAPDIYFLTERQNPTRTFFDAFDADYGTPEHDARLLRLIDTGEVNLVVARNLIEFSPEALKPEMWQALEQRFPNRQFIDNGGLPEFTVMWREPNAARPVQPGDRPVQ